MRLTTVTVGGPDFAMHLGTGVHFSQQRPVLVPRFRPRILTAREGREQEQPQRASSHPRLDRGRPEMLRKITPGPGLTKRRIASRNIRRHNGIR